MVQKQAILYSYDDPKQCGEVQVEGQKAGNRGTSAAHVKGEEGIPSQETNSKVQKESKEIKQLNELIDKSQTVLFETKTVFPFDLFPSTITVDQTKINIINSTLF